MSLYEEVLDCGCVQYVSTMTIPMQIFPIKQCPKHTTTSISSDNNNYDKPNYSNKPYSLPK